MPRKREIEAAIAALTSPDRAAVAARLLTVMFPKDSEYRRSLTALSVATGLSKNTAKRWLAALLDAGLLSKEPAGRGAPSIYHLHLPPRRRP